MCVSLMYIHNDAYKYLPNVHWYLSLFKNKALKKHFVPSIDKLERRKKNTMMMIDMRAYVNYIFY